MPRWAVIGNTGDEFTEKANNLLRKWGPYRTRVDKGKLAFAVSFSKRGSTPLLQHSPWMNSSTIKQFDLSSFPQSPGISEIDKVEIHPDTIPLLRVIIRKKQGVHRLERYCRIIFNSSLAQLPSVIHDTVAPEFFLEYPGGKILFLSGSPNLHLALAALRVLGFAIELADRDFQQIQSIGPFRMLADVQGGGVFYPGKHLSIPIAMFLPRLYGFAADKVSLGFLFLFDKPIPEVRGFYPRSGLEFVRSEASSLFRQSVDLEVDKITSQAVDKFTLLLREFTSKQIEDFLENYLDHLSNFANYMIDPANFTVAGTDEWTALSQYRAWLSYERITDEVIIMLTDDTAFLRKMALFRILDQLATLTTEDPKKQPDVFKQLLLPTGTEDPVFTGLAAYTGEVANYLRQRLEEVRSELLQVVLDSVYLPNRVDESRSTVILRDNTIMSARDYVTNVVRELRNTYHGYYTNRFDTFLAMSSGNTPDSMPVLAMLAYLAFLACPDLFLAREW